MEVAFMVIAILGLLALSGGGSGVASALSNLAPKPVVVPPPMPSGTTYTPMPAQPGAVPMIPSMTANVDQKLFTGVANIGSQMASKSIGGAVQGPGGQLAGAAAGVGIGIVVGIALQLLQAHKARLVGATNENKAVDQYIPVFDSFVQQMVSNYNSGAVTAPQAAAACQQFDAAIMAAFQHLVGAPGTSWNESKGILGICDAGCTVGCCIYYSCIGPVLNNMSKVLGFPTTASERQNYSIISGRTITVPEIYPGKYSSFTRAAYSITLN